MIPEIIQSILLGGQDLVTTFLHITSNNETTDNVRKEISNMSNEEKEKFVKIYIVFFVTAME